MGGEVKGRCKFDSVHCGVLSKLMVDIWHLEKCCVTNTELSLVYFVFVGNCVNKPSIFYRLFLVLMTKCRTLCGMQNSLLKTSLPR